MRVCTQVDRQHSPSAQPTGTAHQHNPPAQPISTAHQHNPPAQPISTAHRHAGIMDLQDWPT